MLMVIWWGLVRLFTALTVGALVLFVCVLAMARLEDRVWRMSGSRRTLAYAALMALLIVTVALLGALALMGAVWLFR